MVVALFLFLLGSASAAATPDRVIILTNSMRDLTEFRAFAKTAARMKRYGRVQIDIGVLARKASFELPAGGNEWHQYAVFNASLSKFFPHPKIAPFWPADWVAKNRELLLAKAAILREFGLEAALSSNDTHYLPEAFFERYPQLRGPRVDHPRRSRREEFSYCVDLPETLEMIEWMTAEARRQIPELKTILVHTNDSGTGLCWADLQYSGPNGPEHCRGRGTGRRLHDLVEAMHRGAQKGGGEVDIRVGGMFSARELDEIARQLPAHTYLSGRDPLLVGGHGASDRDPTAIGVGTMALETYPVLGLINPVGLLLDMENYSDPRMRTMVLGTNLPWYYRADEPLETTSRLLDVVEAGIASQSRGAIPRLITLRELAVRWVGESNADRMVEAFQLVNEALQARKQLGRYSTLYAALSTRHINRPLLIRPEVLTAEEEAYFLPYVFNISESEARRDYIDVHGGRLRAPEDAAAWDRFNAPALKAAGILEQIPSSSERPWLKQTGLSLRMWVSIMESVRNFAAGQRVRDARRQELSSPPPATFKGSAPVGDPEYFAWYEVERREFDNTAGLIQLLNSGGLAGFAHAQRPEDEDTFLFGPNLIETLARKRQLMRAHWLDAQQYLAPPFR